MAREIIPAGYAVFFEKLRARIRQAQIQAIISVNRELMALYWWIGHEIGERVRTQGWGAKVVDRLASDLRRDFPEMKGLSARNLRSFLLELGVGFAFVGNQYHLVVGERDFYLDLLFYHTWLHRYVVIDLKMGEFEPEYVGKMAFFLAAVDDRLRHGDDQGSIGLILCKTHDRLVAEYALRDQGAPMGIATYRVAQMLPEALKPGLPDIEEIEMRLTANTGFAIQGAELTDTTEQG